MGPLGGPVDLDKVVRGAAKLLESDAWNRDCLACCRRPASWDKARM